MHAWKHNPVSSLVVRGLYKLAKSLRLTILVAIHSVSCHRLKSQIKSEAVLEAPSPEAEVLCHNFGLVETLTGTHHPLQTQSEGPQDGERFDLFIIFLPLTPPS